MEGKILLFKKKNKGYSRQRLLYIFRTATHLAYTYYETKGCPFAVNFEQKYYGFLPHKMVSEISQISENLASWPDAQFVNFAHVVVSTYVCIPTFK